MQYLIALAEAERCALHLVEKDGSRPGRVSSTSVVDLVQGAEPQAEAIRAALPGLKRGARLAVSIATPDLRLRRLDAPDVPEEELPQIVRMQVERQATLNNPAVDYSLCPRQEGDEHLTVLAAWITPGVVQLWEGVAAQLGARLEFVTPRSLVAQSLLCDRRDRVLLAISADGQADFVLSEEGAPSMARTTVLSGDEGNAERELKRTLLAAGEATGADTTIDVLHDGMLDSLPKELRSRAARIDLAQISKDLLSESSEPLKPHALGLLRWAAVEEKPSIDFAHPRGAKADDTSGRPRIVLMASAVVVLLAGAWMAYAHLANLRNKVEAAELRLEAAEEGAEQFAPFVERVDKIESWLASDVTWLDELDRLSVRLRPDPLDAEDFPVSTDVRVTQLLATARVGTGEPGGAVALSTRSKSASTVGLERRLRDAQHVVEPISTAEVESPDGYQYQYIASITAPAEVDEPEVEVLPRNETPPTDEQAPAKSEDGGTVGPDPKETDPKETDPKETESEETEPEEAEQE